MKVMIVALLPVLAVIEAYKPPNIVMILGDDIGWSDMGYMGYDLDGATPAMDELANEGVKLYAVYGGTACSPGRAAFLAGRYPIRFGMQNGAINTQTRKGISIYDSLVSDELQKAGYATAVVGKWHVGHAAWIQTPLSRGFDTFYGFMCNGQMDFLTKQNDGYYDLYHDKDREEDADALSQDVRSSFLYDAKVTSFLEEHRSTYGDNKPFFIYIALQDPHTPLSAPDYYLESEPCSDMQDETRAVYCGMMRCIDETVENLMVSLSNNGYASNTLVMFAGDNGGAPKNGGYNWPLRGSKGTLYEGGIRQCSWAWGSMLSENVRGTIYEGPIHLVDMLPTFASLATGGHWQPPEGKQLDGVDVSDAILYGIESPRIEMYTLLNAVGESGGLRWKNWSLLYNCKTDGWYEPGSNNGNAKYIEATEKVSSQGDSYYYLYDVGSDPTQQTDVADNNGDVVSTMLAALQTYIGEQVDYSIDSDKEDGAKQVAASTNYWGPWLDDAAIMTTVASNVVD